MIIDLDFLIAPRSVFISSNVAKLGSSGLLTSIPSDFHFSGRRAASRNDATLNSILWAPAAGHIVQGITEWSMLPRHLQSNREKQKMKIPEEREATREDVPLANLLNKMDWTESQQFSDSEFDARTNYVLSATQERNVECRRLVGL